MARTKQIPKDKIDADKAFDIHKSICEAELARRQLFAKIVEKLVWMFETQSYKPLVGFDPPPSWSSYLALVEIYFTRAQVERWRKIYEVLVREFSFDWDELLQLPESRLEDISRYAKSQPEASELISQAKVLIPSDWKDVIAEHRGLPSSVDCKHPETKKYEECKRCGSKHQI